MLSRVGNSLFWMTRYIERAENIARIVDVNLHLLLDHRRIHDQRFSDYWLPILKSTGDEALFHALYTKVTGQNVTRFLVFRPENLNSIYSCIAQARENARMIRDQITGEMWEEINRLFLMLGHPKSPSIWESRPHEFLRDIKQSALYLHGLADATLARDEGWSFMQVGKFLERADKTTRILDVRCHSGGIGNIYSAGTNDSFEWLALLRSCSAWDSFRQFFSVEVTPAKVVEYLLLSDRFPRSVRFCVSELDHALRGISGAAPGVFTNEAERLSGRLVAEMQFGTVEEIFGYGLPAYLDLLQQKLNAIGDAVFYVYVTRPFDVSSFEVERQQQQQQQSMRRFA